MKRFKFSAQVNHDIHDSEPPPILGSWRNLNIVVICWLVFLILLFYGFTRYFS